MMNNTTTTINTNEINFVKVDEIENWDNDIMEDNKMMDEYFERYLDNFGTILNENADYIKKAISTLLNLKRKEEKDKYFDTIYTLKLNKFKEFMESNPEFIHIYKDVYTLDSYTNRVHKLNEISNILEEKVPGNWVSEMLNKANDIVLDIKESLNDDVKFTNCIIKGLEIILDASYYLSTKELGMSVDEDDINDIKNAFEEDDTIRKGFNKIKAFSLEDFDFINKKSVAEFDKIIELVKTI